MKGKKLLAGVLSAAMVLGTMALPVFADDETNFVATIGDTGYLTLEEAMNAACNMNVEDVNGIPTQTEGVTINITADIENQAGFLARGGKVTAYGQHYVHNVDITLNGNGHKISTGITGSNIDAGSKPVTPKISLASTNGKLTVDNIVATEDLLFILSAPGDAVSDCTQKGEAPAESLIVKNSTFYGNNTGYPGKIKSITYDGNKFLPSESEYDNTDTYPLWYKLDNATLENFTFTNNTVNSQRGVQLARMPEKLNIVYNGNNVTVNNTEKPAKSSALMIGAEQNVAYSGSVNFNGNTINAYSGVCIYSPNENNTGFDFTADKNTLANTKLLGYNEWSSGIDKEAAEKQISEIKYKADESIKWDTATDSGFYMNGDTPLGMMRFLFRAYPSGTVQKVGIRYIKTAGQELTTDKAVTAETSKSAVQGDIIEIPVGNSNKYYAAAFIETTDGTVTWSEPIECSVDWNKKFNEYNPGGAN